MTDINPEALLAYTRARQRTVTARADAARAKLGGVASRSSLTDGLTVEEIERDTKSMRNILRVWKRSGKGGPGSRIKLPSGKEFIAPGDSDDMPSQLERAVRRTPKHLRPKRRKQG